VSYVFVPLTFWFRCLNDVCRSWWVCFLCLYLRLSWPTSLNPPFSYCSVPLDFFCQVPYLYFPRVSFLDVLLPCFRDRSSALLLVLLFVVFPIAPIDLVVCPQSSPIALPVLQWLVVSLLMCWLLEFYHLFIFLHHSCAPFFFSPLWQVPRVEFIIHLPSLFRQIFIRLFQCVLIPFLPCFRYFCLSLWFFSLFSFFIWVL